MAQYLDNDSQELRILKDDHYDIWKAATEEKQERFNTTNGKFEAVSMQAYSPLAYRKVIFKALDETQPIIHLAKSLITNGKIRPNVFTVWEAGITKCSARDYLREAFDPPFNATGVTIYQHWLNGVADVCFYALKGCDLVLCTNETGEPIFARNSYEGNQAKAARLAKEEQARQQEAARIKAEQEAKAEEERRQENLKTLAAIPQSAFEKLMSLVR